MKKAMLLTPLVSISLKLGKYRGKLLGKVGKSCPKAGQKLPNVTKKMQRLSNGTKGVQKVAKTGNKLPKSYQIAKCYKILPKIGKSCQKLAKITENTENTEKH